MICASGRWPQTRERFAESGGDLLPKMCGAMDGGAQAHMDVLVAFFGRRYPPLAIHQTRDAWGPGLIHLGTHRNSAKGIRQSLPNLHINKVPNHLRIFMPEVHNTVVLGTARVFTGVFLGQAGHENALG